MFAQHIGPSISENPHHIEIYWDIEGRPNIQDFDPWLYNSVVSEDFIEPDYIQCLYTPRTLQSPYFFDNEVRDDPMEESAAITSWD